MRRRRTHPFSRAAATRFMTRTPGIPFAIALASISLVGPLAVHLFLPVLPALKEAMGLSDNLAQAAFSVALFGMAVGTLFYGSLADAYGRRPVLLSGLALFLVGSALSYVAPAIEWLIAGRFVQALGAGCGITLVRAIARDAYGPEQLVKAIAYLTMFYTMGPMVAPIISGLLVDHFGWRSAFGFSLVGGALILLSAWFTIYETRPANAGNNGTGLVRGYLDLFSHLRFTCFVMQTGFNTGAFLVTATGAAILMKEMLNRPAAEFGFWFLAYPVGFFFGNFASSRIGKRASIETMVLAGSLLAMAAVIGLSMLLASGNISPATIFIPGFFITFAQGISLPYGQAGAMAVNPKLAGTASGIGAFTQNLLAAVFLQFYGWLANGTVWPLIFVACFSMFCGMICGVLPWRQVRAQTGA